MDYIGAITGILGAWLNGTDARLATGVWLTSNVAFIIWAAYTGTYSILFMQLVYLAINARTMYLRCKRGAK